ncbi:hypothetical protein ASPBRDRAFT_505339 [Aspergillus brasiliensis CBS 101740]|uniref:Uncharacterized protein n=1 Tax=Aspergillus brasiliensis (strain CBS 101740 / IMI 381727 / IBT 21946) TaxID=767769 RepID=A0A1L9UPC9_ASPBC|nr:hypothetical protein ASPBRDRAFT_505339 [Aspergillus brasiliensis CBS 101740]
MVSASQSMSLSLRDTYLLCVRVTVCDAKNKPETYMLLPSPPYSRVCSVTYHTEYAPAFLPVRCKGGNLCKLC